MPENEHDSANPAPVDPLTIGDLLTLQEAAGLHNIPYENIRRYARIGRLKAKKRGRDWFTTSAAVEEYLQSRRQGQRTDLINKKEQNSPQ